MRTGNRFRALVPPIVLAFIVLFMVMYSINTSGKIIENTARFAMMQNARGASNEISASVLAGVVDGEESLVPILQSTFFSEELNSFLCDNDGTIIASTIENCAGMKFSEYLASVGVNEKGIELFEEKLADPDTSVYDYRSSYGNSIASSSAVENTEWTVLYIVPPHSLKGAVRSFRKGDSMVLSSIVIAFGVYILMISFSARKNSARMKHENLKLTKENQKEKERLSEMDSTVRVLAEEYSALYFTDLFTNDTVAYSMDEFARSTYGKPFLEGRRNFFDVVRENYINQYVHPDDVNVLRKLCTEENVYNELKERKSYSLYFRVKRGTEDYHNYKLHILKIGDIKAEPESLIIGFINRDQQVQLEQELREAGEREAKLSEDVCTDILTGLYNRRAYEQDWEQYSSERPGENFVYAALDVNGLKTINDNMGHEAGDELIKGASECMKEIFGSYGKIYRTGGDEFAAMFFADAEELEKLKKDFEIKVESWSGEHVKELAVSAGYVMMTEVSGDYMTELTKTADQRMYQAKSGYYTRKGMDRRGNQDAFRAIGDTYNKIIKIILNDDRCSVIRIEDTEKQKIKDSISEWIEEFASSGIIHDDDLEKFTSKINIENMTEHFKNSSNPLRISYRKLADGNYKNTLMEIVRSKDYAEEMQIVYMYVKIID